MSVFDTMQDSYSIDTDVISKIPIMKYHDLCNCVFCWKYSDVKTCETCNKLFCSIHEKNHMCFKEKMITKNLIQPVTKSEFIEELKNSK